MLTEVQIERQHCNIDFQTVMADVCIIESGKIGEWGEKCAVVQKQEVIEKKTWKEVKEEI